MAQGTKASALIRLRPIENNNIGAIVEEHVRYWKKTRDQEKAEELARKAKAQEFNRKANKDTFEIYDGLQPEENAGFLNDQIISNFEKNKPFYMALAKEAGRGNLDARLLLADEKRKIASAVKINKLYSEKIKEYNEQEAQGTFNEYLDGDKKRLIESMQAGKYKFNLDWSLDIYSPALEEQFKDSSSGLFKDGIVKLNASTLYNNDFFNSTYSKKPQFDENSQAIANKLLDTVDGNQLIDPNTTKVDAIKTINGIFAQDTTELRSFYKYALNKKNDKGEPLISFNKPTGELDAIELNTLAGVYYDVFVEPKVREKFTDTSLDDANKRQALLNKQLDAQKKRQAIKKGKKDLESTSVDLSLATTEDGETIKADLRKGDFSGFDKAVKEGTILNIVGAKTIREVKDDKETSLTYNHLIRDDKTGDLTIVGKYVEKTPILDEEGEPTSKFKESVQYRVIDNDTELNTLATFFDGVTNLTELSDKVKDVIGEEIKKPVYKGLDDDGNPIFE